VSSRADAQWLANADLAPLLARLAGAYDGRRSARAFAAVDRAEASLDRNVSHKAVADWIAFESELPPRRWSAGIDRMSNGVRPVVSVKFTPAGRVHRFLMPSSVRVNVPGWATR